MKLIIAILVCSLLFFLQRALYRRYWQEELDVEVDFRDRIVRESEESALLETITNRKLLPLPTLQVKFSITKTFAFPGYDNSAVTDRYYRNEYFSLRGYEKITRSYPFVCTKRGLFGMRDMDLICKDLMLSEEMFTEREHPALLTVLPKRINKGDIPGDIHKLMGDLETRLKLLDDPFAFASIREYQPYDMMHSVNWKVSAKQNQLMVNTYHTTMQRELVILLNLACNSHSHVERLREEAIRIAATLCAHFIDEGISVSFYTNGCDLITGNAPAVESGADKSHIRTIEVALARIDETAEPVDFMSVLKERVRDLGAKEYLIISNYRREDFLEELQSIKGNKGNVSLIVPMSREEDDARFLDDYSRPGEGNLNRDWIRKWVIADE